MTEQAKTPHEATPHYWYETQERAMAPGIADGWPLVIPAPHTKHGRLVRREGDPSSLQAQVADLSARLRAREEWQTIDSGPEATWVLVAVPNYGINIATMTRDPNILGPNGAYWFIRGEHDRCRPTHWMPLPASPQQELKDLLARRDEHALSERQPAAFTDRGDL